MPKQIELSYAEINLLRGCVDTEMEKLRKLQKLYQNPESLSLQEIDNQSQGLTEEEQSVQNAEVIQELREERKELIALRNKLEDLLQQ